MKLATFHIPFLPHSLYLHYPVCRHICSYCDFNVYAQNKMSTEINTLWLDGIAKHLKAFFEGEREGQRSELKTLYLGGGTPSLLSVEHVERLLAILENYFAISDETEFTLEANPENLSEEFLTHLKRIGVNRLSLGVQTTLASQLRRLERLATAKTLERSVAWVQREFQNFSLDFMIGIPDQSAESLEQDLAFLERIHPPHVSVYILTLSLESRMHKLKTRLVSQEATSEMFDRVCERLRNLGYQHYEVSNFAKPCFQSRHNRNYWNPHSSYLAFGPGAHGYIFDHRGRKIRYEMLRDPASWQMSADGLGTWEVLTGEQEALENLYLRLRSKQPVHLHELEKGSAERFAKESWAQIDDNKFTLTERGWLFIDYVAPRLLPL